MTYQPIRTSIISYVSRMLETMTANFFVKPPLLPQPVSVDYIKHGQVYLLLELNNTKLGTSHPSIEPKRYIRHSEKVQATAPK